MGYLSGLRDHAIYMPDYFEILSLPKQASLNEDELHRSYAALSKTKHPDQGGSDDDAAQLNAAYETLRMPDRRLKHLLETSGPDEAKAWRTVPLDEGLMTLFGGVGKALEASARFLERKALAQTALSKALLANEEILQREALERLGFEIEAHRAGMEAELGKLDELLSSGDASVWKQLAMMQAKFAYLGKWQTQIRERLLALM